MRGYAHHKLITAYTYMYAFMSAYIYVCLCLRVVLCMHITTGFLLIRICEATHLIACKKQCICTMKYFLLSGVDVIVPQAMCDELLCVCVCMFT